LDGKISDSMLEKFSCNSCGQPLFIDKKECREFVEGKLKQGYIICSCCGSRNVSEKLD
jgi:uncharacterized Zn finger protein (UPF0148 family)